MYISAPHIIPQVSHPSNGTPEENPSDPTEGNAEEKVQEQRGWYFSKPELTFNSHDYTDFSWGLEESLEVIQKAFEELGPFDGILGFSQGACLASMLCYMHEKGGSSCYNRLISSQLNNFIFFRTKLQFQVCHLGIWILLKAKPTCCLFLM